MYLNNVAAHVRIEQLEQLLTPFGTLVKLERVGGGGASPSSGTEDGGGSAGGVTSGDEVDSSSQPATPSGGGFQTFEVVFETAEEAEGKWSADFTDFADLKTAGFAGRLGATAPTNL